MWEGGAIYDEWTGDFCALNARCSGMSKNGAKYGIVRLEYSNGTVEEGTFYLEKESDPVSRWGFNRLIDGDKVHIRFYS